MIGGSILGGIGNMMFVIAAVENLARENNTTAHFPNIKQHIAKVQDDRARVYPNSDVSTLDYLKIFRNFTWNDAGQTTRREIYPFHYKPMTYIDSTLYVGYFQSEKYFRNREHILNLFEPSDFVLDKIKKYSIYLTGNTCAIHVRRGDYSLDPNSKHHTKSMEWYNEAMRMVGAETYLVFSDDVEYAKNNFTGKNFVFVEDKDYVELFLMSMCKHNIISSSSFSWWGAWLNKNDRKKVIAPKEWFGGNNDTESTSDIVPDSWIKL